MFSIKRFLPVLVSFAYLLITSQLWAATYYVNNGAANASDGNPGSDLAPWKTIQHGVDVAVAGDTVYVKDGVYYEAVKMRRSGSAGKYITFQSYPGHNPVVDGSKNSDLKLVWWNSDGVYKHYIIWDGIDVRYSKQNGLWVVGNNNIIRNCKIHNNGTLNSTGHTGLQTVYTDYIIISNNEIYNNGWNGMSVEYSDYATIEYNVVHDNSTHAGVNIFPSPGGTAALETGNNIRSNIIYKNGTGIYSRYQVYNEISNNIIFSNTNGGIFFHYESGKSTSYNAYTKVYNNTIAKNGWVGIASQGASYLTIFNNIFDNNKIELGGTGHVLDYNLYYGIIYAGKGGNAVVGDPRFISASTGDYSIAADSPAIDKGKNLAAEGLVLDIVRIARPQGAGFDIGAYEYTTGTVPPVTEPPPPLPEPPPAEIPADGIAPTMTSLVAPMMSLSSVDAPGGSYISTSVGNSGSAVFSFNITQPGGYKIVAHSYASDSATDSFFVQVDGNAIDIWDLNPAGDAALFNIWRQSYMTGRGTGTFDAPQLDPLVVELQAGNHTITIAGREANTRLAYFYLIIETPTVVEPPPVTEPPVTEPPVTEPPVMEPSPTMEFQPSTVHLLRSDLGVLTAPMQMVSSVDAPGGTYVESTASNSGSVVFDFDIAISGRYKLVAETYAPDVASDSFFLMIDNNGEDIWDLNPKGDASLYAIWRQSPVTARGAGTFDAPQYDPLVVQLEAGAHSLTLTGREPNARLAYFYFIMVPGVTAVIEAESGTIAAPMQVVSAPEASGGSYIQSSTSDAGVAAYNIIIPQTGTYKIIATAYAADSASDSFFVNIDGAIEEIWDINPKADPILYNVWRQIEVTGRGTGTVDAPQYDPLIVDLEVGEHTISFKGREIGARLDNFYLNQVVSEPSVIKLEITE